MPAMRGMLLATAVIFASVARDARAGDQKIDWSGPVRWQQWDDGLAAAKTSNKPILLVVYADWCPKSHALIPVFRDRTVAGLAKKFVMVRQDKTKNPAWLKDRFGGLGRYTPRVYFVDARGKVMKDVTSGYAKLKYFYKPNDKGKLVANMRAAVARK